MLMWGASFVGTRVAYGALTPLWLAFLRFAVVGTAMAPYLVMRIDALPRGRALGLACASGLVGITFYYAAENYGVMLTSASVASVVTASFPAIALLVEAAARRTRPSVRSLAGSAISLLGVAILAAAQTQEGATSLWGVCVLLFAGVLWGLYNLMVQGVGEGTDVLLVTGLQFVCGAAGLVPLLALEAAPEVTGVLGVLGALAFLSLGCSLAAYLLYNWALGGLPAATCASMLNLVPVFGLVLSAVVLGEPLSAHKVVACLVTIAGIWWATGTDEGA
jgi:drug/metabolite transporter (DMT)-like permease